MPRGRAEEKVKVWGPGERYPGQPGKRNRWCIFSVTVAGKRIERTCPGITDAEEVRSIAREYLRAAEERAADEQRRQTAAPATFRDLADSYVNSRGLRHKRQAKLLSRLCAIKLPSRGGDRFGDVPLVELRPNLAEEAANVIYGNDGLGTSKNRAVIGPFRAVLRYGARNEYVAFREVVGFPEIKRTTPRPEAADLERLFAVLRSTRPGRSATKRAQADHRYRELIVLYWIRQGWRITESLRLHWDHVNLKAAEFRQFQVCKGAEVKDIDISDDIWEALAGLPEGEEARARASRRGRVFPWVNRHNVYRWLRPICREHKISFTPHMGRVEFASRLDDGGASPVQTVAVGTWTDPRSVERYIRVDKQTRKRTIALSSDTRETTILPREILKAQ